MNMRQTFSRLLGAVLLGLMLASPAHAGRDDSRQERQARPDRPPPPRAAGRRVDDEQDEAYRAVNAGQILSLAQIRAIVARRVGGEFMGVEMDDGGARQGLYVYRLTYRRPSGAVVRVDVNAQTGQILAVRGD